MKLEKLKYFLSIFLITIILNSCASLPGGDARKNPPNPKDRVAKNLEEGKGFRLSSAMNLGGTNFEFASSNELWRATLDTIDFMPLTSANYSGGIIITDWYSDDSSNNESIKIVVRFLSNEIRSDALDIKIFYKNCKTITNCVITEKQSSLNSELRKEILKKAALFKNQSDKKIKKYDNSNDRTREK
tara:strand:- start:1437 stop:1997 length:561 start_codon:yes stop_codon:yes gene_type:complete